MFEALLVAQNLPGGSDGKESACSAMQETGVWSLGGEDTLEKEMAAHSTILAWRIPWTEEPGGLQSVGSKRSDPAERLRSFTTEQG